MLNPFTEHPNSIGETYIEHAKFASLSGVHLIIAGIACIIHGFLPFLFVHTGSQTVGDLHEKFSRRTQKNIPSSIMDSGK